MSLKLAKVLVLDGVDIVCENKLKQAGIEVTTRGKLSKEELVREINLHDALIVRSATKVTADVLEGSNRLKVIGRAGTGVDNIDVDAATRKGVLIMNTPGGNTLSAAEHTCALICSLARSIPEACASLKTGAWDRKKFLGNELSEKVLAVVGLGRIGREVCDRMKSFGMGLIGYDPLVDAETAASWGIEYLPLKEIWPRADYITVHTPLIPQTRYLINENTLKACKPTVKIVNVARGGIVEEKALLKALENGTCGGVALDVYEEEPPKDLRLVKHPKVICTPHLGANTVEAQRRVAVEIADQFVAMSEGKQLVGLVNVPSLVEAGSAAARPWIALASSLGKVASKFVKPEKGTQLSIHLRGDVISSLSKLMIPAILRGFLEYVQNINLVNSPLVAKEAGVDFTVKTYPELKSEALNLSNSMELLVQGGSLKCSLIGSTAGSNAVLFSINNCFFTCGLTLEKNLLFFNTSNPQGFGSVATAFQNSSLLALLSSSSSEKEAWIVARTEDNVANIPSIEQTKLVAQIRF